MRVVLVSHRYRPDAVAGVERCTEAVADELARRGDSVAVVARRPARAGVEPRLLREASGSGVHLYRLVGGEASRDRAFVADHHRRLERLFEMVLLEMAPDVVHVNHLIDLSPRFMEIALRHLAAVVLSLHDFYFACPRIILQKVDGQLCAGPDGGVECARTCFSARERSTLRLRATYFRRLLALPQYVLCPSNYVADYFRRFTGDGGARFVVVPNATWVSASPAEDDDQRPRRTPAERGRLHLVFLGSVVRHKGVDQIVHAVHTARLPIPVRIDVHGPAAPDYAKQLRELAAAVPGLTLHLHGAYEPNQVPELLRDADCLVAPSQWPESFLLVTREAMACGVPVVVTRLGALPDAVKEGENGLSFDHDRPEQLAEVLRRFATDCGLVRRLRAGARATPAVGVADHVDALRGYYRRAMVDLAAPDSGERMGPVLEDLSSLHEALAGVDAAPRGIPE